MRKFTLIQDLVIDSHSSLLPAMVSQISPAVLWPRLQVVHLRGVSSGKPGVVTFLKRRSDRLLVVDITDTRPEVGEWKQALRTPG